MEMLPLSYRKRPRPMSNFSQFYQQGGVFMHVITLLSLGSALLIVTRALRLRELVRSGSAPAASPDDPLVRGLLVTTGLVGLLGATFGFIEIAAALRTVPTDQWMLALNRAFPPAVTTIAWSLVCVVPLVLARSVVLATEQHLRQLRGTRAATS